ncbi:antibiotic biosynthesis monooxygenase [Streptomyces sp. NPDC087425]|uniref:antibiotic biosynthesis monooxygenase n=1 Tax=unclassified Streptomyces TaxID=2593676 RepID=UPI00381C947A
MTHRIDTHPDHTDPRAAAVFVSSWRVDGRQAEAVEAIARTWESRPWPSADLLSYHVYAGLDGATVLHYSQWASEPAHATFVKIHRQERNDAIDTAVPGIERLGLGRFRRYRSLGPADRGGRVPGCVVVVDVDFEGPDPERQRAWADAVADALTHDPDPHPGAISTHVHLSTDGARVLNYAEWESAQDHIDALAVPGDGIGSPADRWRRVQTWPGLKSGTVRRYHHALGLAAD